MDIILVRVSSRADGTLYIERKTSATTSDDYIAISHVWGNPATISSISIEGVKGKVSLSPGKIDILNILQRGDICGGSWFWMDLFCIDQSPNAPISISQQLAAIPAVYKHSRCVKILLESPICTEWTAIANRTIFENPADEQAFLDWEIHHSRRCPHMPFLDPWFERLWTRQEGLYGMRLEAVLLNPIPCTRVIPANHSVPESWSHIGSMQEKRIAALYFAEDKLLYHGLSRQDAEKFALPFYIDLCYRHRAVVIAYNGEMGPHSSYSPIAGAWRSTRITTKTRDYFLAVFPDVTGYVMPKEPRKMTFEMLLLHAFGQQSVQQHFLIASKVPKGMIVQCREDESASPWISESPEHVAEALDGFLCPAKGDLKFTEESRYFETHPSVALLPLVFTIETLPEILMLWSSADANRHVNQIHPAGPCTGSNLYSALTSPSEIALGQFLIQQFTLPAWKTLGFAETERTRNLSFEDISKTPISPDIFSTKLQEFLVCLICGTTSSTARIILQSADLVIVQTSSAKLLGLVNKEHLKFRNGRISLLHTSAYQGQGLLLSTRRGLQKGRIVGRTVIPRNLDDYKFTGVQPNTESFVRDIPWRYILMVTTVGLIVWTLKSQRNSHV